MMVGKPVRQRRRKRENIGTNSSCIADDSRLASLLSMPVQDGVFAHVIQFLDPGLDFPTCRLVHPSWNKWVCSITEKQEHSTTIWMSSLRIQGQDGYSERLRLDYAMLRETTERERELYLEERTQDDPDYEYDIDDHDRLWLCRTDDRIDPLGYCEMSDWEVRPAIVSARLMFNIRNAHLLINSKGRLKSDFFSFGGSLYSITIGAEERRWNGGTGGWFFGIKVERREKSLTCSNKERQDPTAFAVSKRCRPVIRYQATFTAGAGTFRVGDFKLLTPLEGRYQPSVVTCATCTEGEYFPLSIAEFALGPSPACQHLRIAVKLEHLGYGYTIW